VRIGAKSLKLACPGALEDEFLELVFSSGQTARTTASGEDAEPMENEPTTIENGEQGCENTTNGGIKLLDSTPHARSNAAKQAGSSFSALRD
jgi:hypothetical protein